MPQRKPTLFRYKFRFEFRFWSDPKAHASSPAPSASPRPFFGAAREAQSALLVFALEHWLRDQRALLSKHAKVGKAIDYLLSPDHWPGFTRFLDDGRICLTNNSAERSLRGGHRAAFKSSMIGTEKLNNIDPQAWLADVIALISDLPVSRLPELLPWQWTSQQKAKVNAIRG
ncbi:hypothetical protein GCM10011452_28200 [Gemmobacter lanyuensis]|uniref:Transposase IS66 C-terminal domain-containing protein n=1 Tax=Gemmobacter lanyuensis TaxID=1054497 RepID=A0A918IY26_9RHOB|nr:hypothetical protein GCM10011452_28200 [Gemmobacter lanyuensis]